MKEEYTKDMEEDIRQVPLNPGGQEGARQDRPVGASHIGGAGLGSGAARAASPGRSRARREKWAEGLGEAAGLGKVGAHGKGVAPEADSGKRVFSRPSGRGGIRRGVPVIALILALAFGIGAGLSGGYYLWGWERPYMVDLKAVEVPGWVRQEFIRKNIFSRPDVSRQRVNNIVIHYVANPGSTAEGNRNYFDSLADQDPQKSGVSTSSHFVVGLEGEAIQCIPITEIAYANAPRNYDTVSIEVCHPDATGKFNDATYETVVNLTAALCRELKLTSRDVLRHYDINGKICPKYFVDNEDAWEQFKKDVDAAMKGPSM